MTTGLCVGPQSCTRVFHGLNSTLCWPLIGQEVTASATYWSVVSGSGSGEMFRSSDWADRCVYQCRMCLPPEVFDTHSKMSYHVKKRHNMAMKDYTTQFGRAMIHEEKHSCQICGSHVLWERSSIYQHIYQVSKLPISLFLRPVCSGPQ